MGLLLAPCKGEMRWGIPYDVDGGKAWYDLIDFWHNLHCTLPLLFRNFEQNWTFEHAIHRAPRCMSRGVYKIKIYQWALATHKPPQAHWPLGKAPPK